MLSLRCNKVIKNNLCNYVKLLSQQAQTLPDHNKHTVMKNDFTQSDLQSKMKFKLNNVLRVYEEVSGLDEVRAAQDKVIEIQDQLIIVQERRRKLLLELSLIQKEIKDLHVQIKDCVRGELRYVELVKQEFKIMQTEKELNELFKLTDMEERELFTHLTASVKFSHDKERTQANNVKYWSIIGSLIGALLGIITTSISFYSRNSQYATTSKSLHENNNLIRSLIQNYKDNEKPESAPGESWASYIKRIPVSTYRYFRPIKQKSE